jgi:hypothetical protein
MVWGRKFVAAFVALAATLLAGACSPVFVATCQKTLVTSSAGPITDPALTEVSGIHAGVRNPGVWWVHNDSGDTARVFALDHTGATRGEYAFSGVTALDWEDLTVVPGSQPGSGIIYAGDIGDNGHGRNEIRLFRVAEPAVPMSGPRVTEALSGVETLHLTYPDGPHDAEAFVIDPDTNDIVIITKSLAGGTVGVYRAPGPLAAGSTTQLTKAGDLTYPDGLANAVTSADITGDGNVIAVRTYGAVRVYNRSKGVPVINALHTPYCSAPLPAEVQGEAVGFDSTATAIATVSEGAQPTLHISAVP